MDSWALNGIESEISCWCLLVENDWLTVSARNERMCMRCSTEPTRIGLWALSTHSFIVTAIQWFWLWKLITNGTTAADRTICGRPYAESTIENHRKFVVFVADIYQIAIGDYVSVFFFVSFVISISLFARAPVHANRIIVWECYSLYEQEHWNSLGLPTHFLSLSVALVHSIRHPVSRRPNHTTCVRRTAQSTFLWIELVMIKSNENNCKTSN